MKKNTIYIIITLVVLSLILTVLGLTYHPKTSNSNKNNQEKEEIKDGTTPDKAIVYDGNNYPMDDVVVSQDEGPSENDVWNEGSAGIG